DGVIEASLVDYYYTKVLFEEYFWISVDGIHPKTREVMDAIRDICGARKDDAPIFVEQLHNRLGWGESTIRRWADGPLEPYGWVERSGQGRPTRYKLGTDPAESRGSLPSVEELAEQFPDLAADFKAVHPITGDAVSLQRDEEAATTSPHIAS